MFNIMSNRVKNLYNLCFIINLIKKLLFVNMPNFRISYSIKAIHQSDLLNLNQKVNKFAFIIKIIIMNLKLNIIISILIFFIILN